MLTTTEAAKAAAVAPSTIKRWADQGMLPFSRTAGGHRRFERFAIERLLREHPTFGCSSRKLGLGLGGASPTNSPLPSPKWATSGSAGA
jgi:excisionase family DNA binding protein